MMLLVGAATTLSDRAPARAAQIALYRPGPSGSRILTSRRSNSRAGCGRSHALKVACCDLSCTSVAGDKKRRRHKSKMARHGR